MFDRIFGTTSEGDFTDGQMIDGGDYWGYQGYQTVRTVCVRLSDGYFWPISYATLPDYVSNDAQQCQRAVRRRRSTSISTTIRARSPSRCATSIGEPYTSLPTAFAYRDALDTSPSASCKVAPRSDGIDERGDGQRWHARAR